MTLTKIDSSMLDAAILDGFNTLTQIRLSGTWTPGAVPAKFGRSLVASANDQTLPEIGDYFEMNQTVEPTGAFGSVYKIGIGGIVKSTANVPELYGMNPVVDGKFGAGFGSGFGIEADINNRGSDADTIAGSSQSYGFIAASGGTKRITAGFWSPGFFDIPKANYGFAATGFTNVAGFYDSTNAPSAVKIAGAHTYGVNMLGVGALSYTLALPNSVPMVQADAGGNLRNILNVNGSSILELGSGALGYIQANQSVLFSPNNTYTVGAAGAMPSAIWAANGTIQTSDPRLKADKTPLPDIWPVIDAIDPITFKWISGGQEAVEIEEDGEVQATEDIEVSAIELIDGKYVEVMKTEVRPIFDAVPVYDKDGNELVTVRPALIRAAELDDDGNVVKEAETIREEQVIPRLHFVPRMVAGKIKRTEYRDVHGKRTHWGFNAAEVKAAFDGIGMDFGGYVEAENGTMSLRPDQLIPVLWKAVQDLRKELDAIKSQSAA